MGIDGLPLTLDLPQAILRGLVAHGLIATLFQPVRDDAPVLTITDPVGGLSAETGCLLQHFDGDCLRRLEDKVAVSVCAGSAVKCPRLAEAVDYIGEFRLFG